MAGIATKERKKAYSKKYWAANKERLSAQQRAYNVANRAQIRASRLKRTYGISLEQFDRMATTQGDVCAICEQACTTFPHLSVDHDHDSLRIRGLLCRGCNSNLGWFEKHEPAVIGYLAIDCSVNL